MGPFNPESLATFPSRTTLSRTNAYPQPLAAKSLASGLPSFDSQRLWLRSDARRSSAEAITNPAFKARTEQSKKTRQKKTKNCRKPSSKT